MRKRQVCIDAGYDFEFWVWDNQEKRFDIKKNETI